MDNKDRQIIRALQRDGRMTNQELADKVNLSPSPCLRRLRNMEASGAIQGFSVNVNPISYGLPITAYVQIRLERHNKDTVKEFENRISMMDEVQECHMLTGGVDYLVRVVVKGLEDYEDFIRNRIHSIDGIRSIDTSFVYGTIKKTGVFPRIE